MIRAGEMLAADEKQKRPPVASDKYDGLPSHSPITLITSRFERRPSNSM